MFDGCTFERIELKYMLTRQQYAGVQKALEGRMAPDRYGLTSIRNLYCDTDTFRLVRRSIEKPIYKEKLRIRSYGPASRTDDVFVELKKKYRGIVYKRRLILPEETVMACMASGDPLPDFSQIGREIEALREFYGPTLKPAVFLAYNRVAYAPARPDIDLRVTFDTDIRYRTDRLTLGDHARGTALTGADQVLMEVKVPGAMPLWFTGILSRLNIRQVSYSKYGSAYLDLIRRDKGGSSHVIDLQRAV